MPKKSKTWIYSFGMVEKNFNSLSAR